MLSDLNKWLELNGVSTSTFLLLTTSILVLNIMLMVYVRYRRLKPSDHINHKSPINNMLKVSIKIYLPLLFIAVGILIIRETGHGTNFIGAFIGSFICVTAGQILLSAIGIQSEILGNVPSEIDYIDNKDANRKTSH